MFTRKSILKKTQQVGLYTLLSRCLGIMREYLTVRYMGATAIADAFFTAWKVPNLLRKIFAEGALSATFVPAVIKTIRSEGKHSVHGLMFLGFIAIEGFVLLLCAVAMIGAHYVITFIAPGFLSDQVATAVLYLRILMPFIFLISTSALLAGPLQAIGQFFVPAFGPVLLNIAFIAGLIICLWYHLPVTALCWFIIVGGIIQLIAHIIVYIQHGFSFRFFDRQDIKKFGWVLIRLIPSVLSMSVVEMGMVIDTSFATLLPAGSVSLLYYANRFMGIPLGVFAVALSTTLLPYFSRVGAYAPRRLSFYLLETTKLVWWVTVPVAVIMMLLSQKLFVTLFLSEKFSLAQAYQAASILMVTLCGLFFFSINKILSNVYYALHQTWIPAVIAVLSVGINILLDWLLIGYYQAVGLAAATTIAAMIQTLLLYGILAYIFQLPLYINNLLLFIGRYAMQLIIIGAFFISIYWLFLLILMLLSLSFFIDRIGFWVWVGPLCVLFMGMLYMSRQWFNIRILFLEKE
jgi:putative peptidoglycan lipid II flippase